MPPSSQQARIDWRGKLISSLRRVRRSSLTAATTALSTTSAAPASWPSQTPRIFTRSEGCADPSRPDDLTIGLGCDGRRCAHTGEEQIPDQAEDEDGRDFPQHEMRHAELSLV